MFSFEWAAFARKIKTMRILIYIALTFGYVSVEANIVKSCVQKNSERNCLICNCFFETRGEPDDEKREVTRTVRRRILRTDFPNNACKVVNERGQFSWAPTSKSVPNIATARRCVEIVDEVMAETITSTNPSFFNVCGIGSWAEGASNCTRRVGFTGGAHCWFDCKVKGRGGRLVEPSINEQYTKPMKGNQ